MDPLLADPEHGDYRPLASSPARDYGCQTFRAGARPNSPPPLPPTAPRLNVRRDVIDVAGPVRLDTTWDADLVRVVGDVAVEDGATLTILPGVRVEFQGYYRLTIAGALAAVGTPAERILFTAANPEAFTTDAERTGCWNGLRFVGTADNPPSELMHCVFEYSKALSGDDGTWPYGGGALSVIEFSHLTIANCIFRHNLAEFGGALFLYRNANPLIAGNLIVDNHVLGNASAIYAAYSHPRLVNNTIVRNTIHNDANPYFHTCGVEIFVGKPGFTNNIIRDNLPTTPYTHSEVLNYKVYYAWANNIDGIAAEQGNFDANPRFIAPLGPDGVAGTFDDDFRLSIASPGLDAGVNQAWTLPTLVDLDGADRLLDSDGVGGVAVDQGAFEFGDCDRDGILDIKQIAGGNASDCNENYVPDYCELAYHGTGLDCNLNDVLDECEEVGAGDFNNDGVVGLSDLPALLDSLGGPARPPTPGDEQCEAFHLTVFDADGDGDVDLADVAAFAGQFDRTR